MIRYLVNRVYKPGAYVIQRYLYHFYKLNELGGGVFDKIRFAYHYYYYMRLSYKTGFQIARGTCGKNLRIFHWGPIIVNSNAKLGDNCRLYPGVIIGSTETGCPTIGDNVYIGASSKIIGGIIIGSNVIIAPNAVVNRNVPDNTIVAGVPAKVIKEIKKEDFPRLNGYILPI